MEKKIWSILGISKTKDVNIIKEAYYDKLSKVNPEDDQEGFMALRQAYEEAINYSNSADDEEKDEVDLWIDQVQELYDNYDRRMNIGSWNEIFHDDVCVGLDSRLEAKEKFIVFLMSNYRLPIEVWQLINNEFDIEENNDRLLEKFPEQFVKFMIDSMHNEDFFDLSLFIWKNNENVDEYIMDYYNVKDALEREDIDEAIKNFDILSKYESYHVYSDVERLRILIHQDNQEEARVLMDYLKENYISVSYVEYYLAESKYKLSDVKGALEGAEKLLQKIPDHFYGTMLKGKCLSSIGRHKEAKDLIFDLMYKVAYSDKLQNLIIQINDEMMKCLNKDNQEDALEYAWCLYQNERCQEAEDLLKEIDINKVDEYYYINLISRVKLINGKYEEAYKYLNRWIDMILDTKEDDPRYYKRHRLLDYAYSSLGGCCQELHMETEAEKYIVLAVKEAENKNGALRLEMKERLAWLYYTQKRYEDCIKVCDEIIEQEPNYYAAYLRRQDAEMKIGYDREVIRDYYESTRIYPDFIRPYNNALEVYLNYSQYDDAKAIIDRVKELNLDNSNRFTLLCVRYDKESTDRFDLHKALHTCMELKKKLDDEDNDIEDKGDLNYEIALLYERKEKYDKSLEAVKEAIDFDGKDYYYHLLAYLYGKLDDVNKRIDTYKEGIEKNPKSVMLLYSLGRLLYDMDDNKESLKYLLRTQEICDDYKDSNELISKLYECIYDEDEDLKDNELAIHYATKDIETCTEEAYTYYYINRGLRYQNNYAFKEAIEDYKKALEYHSDDWAGHNNIGYVAKIMRNMDVAIKELKEAIKYKKLSESPLPYANLAATYMIMKDYDNAIKYYEAIKKEHPDIFNNLKYLSEAYMSIGEYDKCVDIIKELAQFKDEDLSEVYMSLLNFSYFQKQNGKKISKELVNEYEKLYIKCGKKDSNDKINYILFKIATDFNYKKTIKQINEVGDILINSNMSLSKLSDNCAMLALSLIQTKWKLKTEKQSKKNDEKIKYLEELAFKFGKKGLDALVECFGSVDHYLDYKSFMAARCYYVSLLYLGMKDYDNAKKYGQYGKKAYQCPRCIYGKCHEAYEILIAVNIENGNYEEARELINEIMQYKNMDMSICYEKSIVDCMMDR